MGSCLSTQQEPQTSTGKVVSERKVSSSILSQDNVEAILTEQKTRLLYFLDSTDQLRIHGKTSEAREYIAFAQSSGQNIPADHPSRTTLLESLSIALEYAFRDTCNLSDIDQAISVQSQIVQLCNLDQIRHAPTQSRLSSLYRIRFKESNDLKDMDSAISSAQIAVTNLTSSPIADGDAVMDSHYQLASALQCRHGYSKKLEDIIGAISSQRTVVILAPSDHPILPSWLQILAEMLEVHYSVTQAVESLDEAISHEQRAIQLVGKDEPSLSHLLHVQLARLYEQRSMHYGQTKYSADSIRAKRNAIRSLPDGTSKLPLLLGEFAESLFHHFSEVTNASQDLDEAISTMRAAIGLSKEGDSSHIENIYLLGTFLDFRYDLTKDLSSLDEAIVLQRAATNATHSEDKLLPQHLSLLSQYLGKRFFAAGAERDIDQAISLRRKAIKFLHEPSEHYPTIGHRHAALLVVRFEQRGQLTDLDEAISLETSILPSLSDSNATTPEHLFTLSSALMFRFKRQGNMSDINQAITYQQGAIALITSDDVKLPDFLNNLGTCFHSRFSRHKDLADIYEAVLCHRDCVDKTPPTNPVLPNRLNNLSISLSSLYDATLDPKDLDAAIVSSRKTIEGTPPGHRDLPLRLSNLGRLLQARFSRQENVIYLDEAISCFVRALELRPADEDLATDVLKNSATAYLRRFEVTKQREDVLAAAAALQACVDRTQDGHPSLQALMKSFNQARMLVESTD
ncbi:hypothetical protein FA15DRAFT_73289 [Coprinopsis marcescibilis]|uniref:TPR-like protein n=1 Tax=Coprinopsis marcescibilis TaxID=230819 RepID=A0A5C3KNH5_COPMA|nr:hypothetical protein FA15DRAFT_73289 [Coprinopsis marcescibilis]